jgi:mono/diheme cytochrome c family protein
MSSRDPRIAWRLLLAVAAAMLVTTLQGAAQHGERQPDRSLLVASTTGEDMFRFYCSSCHGLDGKGRSPRTALHATPPDLTRLAATHHGVFPRERVRNAIALGREAPSHQNGDMPRWGWVFRSLDASETVVEIRIANLVEYLESLQRADNQD